MISFLIDFSMLKLENQMLLLGGDSSSTVGTYESRSYFILFVIFFCNNCNAKNRNCNMQHQVYKSCKCAFQKTNSSTRPMRILFSCQVSRFEFETSNSQTDRHSKYKIKRQNCILGENSLDFRV